MYETILILSIIQTERHRVTYPFLDRNELLSKAFYGITLLITDVLCATKVWPHVALALTRTAVELRNYTRYNYIIYTLYTHYT